MDGYKLGFSMGSRKKAETKITKKKIERKKEGVSMDQSAQNIDRSSDCDIRNLRRLKYVFDVAPLEIIYNQDEDFIRGGGGVLNINQIDLVIHAINHDTIFQYWSLKSSDQQLNSSSSSCHDQHHRDHLHLRDDDDDEEMIMVTCQPLVIPNTRDTIIRLDRGVVFASYEDDHRQKVEDNIGKDHHAATATADDYIMSQLNDVDAFYELEWISTYEQLEEVKRGIIQRISEAKFLLAKPKTVRIRVDFSTVHKFYYANPAAASSAHAEYELDYLTTVEKRFAIHYPVPTIYDDMIIQSLGLRRSPALRSSREALETKIFQEEEDLISSSSSCLFCLKKFRVGVDVTNKMPCSHIFHSSCLMDWLLRTNTCPLCDHELPTFQSRFQDQLPQ